MKKTVKKVISSVLVAAMLLSFVPMSGKINLPISTKAEAVESEENGFIFHDGNQIKYSFEKNTGIVVISGHGELPSISDFPFEREDIKQVIVEKGITTIDGTFYNCNNLKRVQLPEGLKCIDGDAFTNCISLTDINIPYGVEIIGNAAFNNCKSLKEVTLPDSIMSIGFDAFSETSIPGWNVNDEKSENEAFYLNNYLIKVSSTVSGEFNVKEGTIGIADWALIGCNKITKINLPEGIKTIGKLAFQGCSSLYSINIPRSVINIGFGVFDESGIIESWTALKIDSGNNPEFDSLYIDDCLISIDSEYTGDFTVRDNTRIISGGIFDGLKKITKVIIPESVVSIGCCAFQNSSVISVEIPNSVTYIGEDAFAGCDKLVQIDLPKNLNKIEAGSFSECSSLMDIFIPSNVTIIDDYAFYGCTGLKDITVPEAVSTIGDNIFRQCSNLKEIKLPRTVNALGECVFKDANKLVKVNIPENLISIPYGAFWGCTELVDFVIPEAVISIESDAFRECAKKDLVLPDNVVYIETDTFAESAIESVVLPQNLLSVGDGAFTRCKNLKEVIIPDNTVVIGYKAFYSCESLETVLISKGVRYIHSGAFAKCPSLSLLCIETESFEIFSSGEDDPEEDYSINYENITFLVKKDTELCNSLISEGINVIPYSFTVNKDDKDKPMLALDGKVVLTEDMWSCICRLVKDTDVQYIYFGELDVSKMLSSDVLENVDESSLKSEKVTLSIIRDGETIRLGNVEEKTSFQKIVEAVTEFFTFVLNSVYKGIKGVWASIKNWWKR